jgi:hypothetical protein
LRIEPTILHKSKELPNTGSEKKKKKKEKRKAKGEFAPTSATG